MNYTVAGGRLLFRTTPDTEAGRCANRRQVAFEVDQIDESRHAGWSVLVTGEALRSPSANWNCSTSSSSRPLGRG